MDYDVDVADLWCDSHTRLLGLVPVEKWVDPAYRDLKLADRRFHVFLLVAWR